MTNNSVAMLTHFLRSSANSTACPDGVQSDHFTGGDDDTACYDSSQGTYVVISIALAAVIGLIAFYSYRKCKEVTPPNNAALSASGAINPINNDTLNLNSTTDQLTQPLLNPNPTSN